MALPDGAVPLVVGTALALGALTMVLAPLLSGGEAEPLVRGPLKLDADDEPASYVDALREIEFDRATGKLSDVDYADLKARYTKLALEELRAGDRAVDLAERTSGGRPVNAGGAMSATDPDPVEAAIGRARANQRSCQSCGPRSEPDAIYCSDCGRYLPGACGSCGETVDLKGARFCNACGASLAA
ncbi:MAG TPA: zinc ribbon domain-containing protein [Gemmatimonas sp.]|uniref:zinc ribbon domain-containing protein n=1 Tax=Gemmatimonas sp. TaxID=1962908 RepID=UPI002EDBAD31